VAAAIFEKKKLVDLIARPVGMVQKAMRDFRTQI
jgi:hypothetical protein